MFPHTITIYHHSVVDGADVYDMTTLSGCYWMHTVSRAGAGKGAEKTDSYTIVLSPEQTAKYGTVWNVYPGDRVVRGVRSGATAGKCVSGAVIVGHTSITSWKELTGDVMIVKTVEENICGSSVDNITLIC